MIVELLKTSMSYKPKKTILLFMQIMVSFIVLSMTLSLFNLSNNSVNKLKHVTKELYKISDNYEGNEEKSFFARSDNVGALKSLYKWENTTNLFNYIVMNRQIVCVENKKWPESCLIDYSSEEISDIYRSIQVNPNFFKYFDIKLSEGKFFNDDDYILDDNIPILMGSDYKDFCLIGESFDLYYMGATLPCTIVGFIEENSYINNGQEIEYLNNQIILPSLELKDNYDTGFALRLYLDKTAGFIQTDEKINNLQNELTQQCISVDILPFTIEGCNGFYLSMWGLEGKQLRNVLLSMFILVCMTTVICVSLNLSLKIRHFKKQYAIYIANGIRRKNVEISIIIEILMLNFAAMIIANYCCFILGKSQNICILFFVAIIMAIISSVYPISCFNKLNIATAMRGKE